MKNFKLINNLTGWAVFFVALTVYALTLEPTASFWDCGEFIAASYKLQIPHPPGPPFFLLLGRFFTFLALGDTEQIAFWVNMMSAVSSALAVMFLYWSIVLLASKILKAEHFDLQSKDALVLMGSGVTGSLAFAFSDTFWFSAVEAEVYAMSMFFTAVAFWAILRWDALENASLSNKWLLFIAYLMGLSIGVHPMNLLTIPSLALIYYFKNYTFSWKGLAVTIVSSGIGILFVMFGFRVGVMSLLTKFEIFFVNSLKLDFGSGAAFGMVTITASILLAVYFTQKKGLVGLNTLALCISFLIIGYSSFGILTIRSSKNPLIDMWNPENLPNFVGYLDMKQYGTRPLLYGNYYDAKLIDQQPGDPVYQKGETAYEIEDYDYNLTYDPTRTTVLPRLWSQRDRHPEAYQQILGLPSGQKPNFSDNLKYLFTYQLGHMYMRYFMWNFAGRESDQQDAGFVALTSSVAPSMEGNHARNSFLMLPLVLGLVGLFFNYKKNVQSFSVIGVLFFITGVGLVLYLNSPPSEPRERDYIYVASFFAFCIWIGLGAFAFLRQSQQFFAERKLALAMAWFATLMVPGIMVMQGWDDHDRSGRYYSVDMAKNYMVGCEPNGILFTGGDNDTYPLWYAQDVEGVRTDMRVIVGTLFSADWNIDMMKRKAYESEPLPFSIEKTLYKQGGLIDYVPVVENPNLKGEAINLIQYLNLLKKKHPAIMVETRTGSSLASLPSKLIRLPVNKDDVLARHLVPDTMTQYIPDYITFEVTGSGLQKSEIMLLDLIASNNWERPIYFTHTALSLLPFDLNKYVVQEGMTYKLLPVENPESDSHLVNSQVMFANMTETYSWRNLNNPDVNYSSYYQKQLMNPRMGFNSLAETLMLEGKNDQALEALHKSLSAIPDDTIPYDISAVETTGLLMALNDSDTALAIGKTLIERADRELSYYSSTLKQDAFEVRKNLFVLDRLQRILKAYGFNEDALKTEGIFRKHYSHFEG
ncbi:MAG: DUF2723 domain-containing protein [Imperialibacter sp.]|uniref:DUF2723 domain-containing protein n=1 Tax=Imperialibacter sp. TaxID=2038411 RepID=UPI0032EB08AB